MSEWAGVAALAIVCGSLVALVWIGSRRPLPRRQERPRDLPLWSYGIQPTEYKAPPPPPKQSGGIGTPTKAPTRGPDNPKT